MRRQVLVAGGILAAFAAVMVGTATLYLGGAQGTAPLPTVESHALASRIAAPPTSPSAPTPTATTVTPAATVTPSKPAPSPSPAVPWRTEPGTPEREVEAAYLRYWQVRTEALRTTDPSKLPEVMAGAELERTQEQIAQLRAQGQAGRVDVEHNYFLADISADSAVVHDEYRNRSVRIDAQTGRDLQNPGEGEAVAVSYQLRKVDGTWKVVDGALVVEE